MKTKKQILREWKKVSHQLWRIRHEIRMRNGEYDKVTDKGELDCIKGAIKNAKKTDRETPILIYGKPLPKADLQAIWRYQYHISGQLRALNYVLDDTLGYKTVEDADSDT